MEKSNIRAILKPNGFRSDRKLGLKEQLHGYEQSPMVAYGEDRGSYIEYEEAVDKGELASKISAIRQIALDNNSSIVVNYSTQIVEGQKILISDFHEYACERILDTEYLTTVAKELESDSFLVGIPHQGLFMAISSMSSYKRKFVGFTKQKFENPEADPIIPHVFEVFKGEIVAVVGADTGNIKNTIVQLSNGDLVVELMSDNFEEYKDQFSAGYAQAMLLVVKSSDFSGNMIFNENNASFVFDHAVLEKCRSYVDQITSNEMAQTIVQAISGNAIKPTFTHVGRDVNLERPKVDLSKRKKWWQFGR